MTLWEWQKYKRENPCFLYDDNICKEIKPKITITSCVKYLSDTWEQTKREFKTTKLINNKSKPKNRMNIKVCPQKKEPRLRKKFKDMKI